MHDHNESELELEHHHQAQLEQDDFFKKLFNVLDTDGLGYITVENFTNIFKQNIIDQSNDSSSTDYYENKITEVVNSLDPNNLGRIDYSQFVNGMTKLNIDFNNNSNDEIKPRKATFTFEDSDKLEQTVDLLRLNYTKPKQINDSYDEDEIDPSEKSNYESSSNNNTLEEIFEDDNTHNSPNKSSSNETDNYDFIDEINSSDLENNKISSEADDVLDMFGIDSTMINNHRKSLSSNSSLIRQQFLQKKRLSLSYTFDAENEEIKPKSASEDLAKYEEIVQNLEKQITNLTNENESLKYEITEQINRNKSLNQENLCLVEKLQGAEEHSIELERRSNYLLEEEKQKNQEILNKMYNAHIEEQTSYFSQIRNLEAQLSSLKSEHSVRSKQYEELIKSYEMNEALLNKEETKVKKLTEQIEELHTQMNYLELENANQIAHYDKQIKDLMFKQDEIQNELNAKENTLINLQNNNLAVQNELSLRLKLETLEKENQQLKNEIEQLNSNLDVLNAQLYKTNLEGGIFLEFPIRSDRKESTVKNVSSFENEMNTMSRDELLNKLVQEQQMSARLKDYIDDLIPKILEYCPKIFEIEKAQKKR